MKVCTKYDGANNTKYEMFSTLKIWLGKRVMGDCLWHRKNTSFTCIRIIERFMCSDSMVFASIGPVWLQMNLQKCKG